MKKVPVKADSNSGYLRAGLLVVCGATGFFVHSVYARNLSRHLARFCVKAGTAGPGPALPDLRGPGSRKGSRQARGRACGRSVAMATGPGCGREGPRHGERPAEELGGAAGPERRRPAGRRPPAEAEVRSGAAG